MTDIDLPIEDRTARGSRPASAWLFSLLSIVAGALAAVVLTHGHLVRLGFALFFLSVLCALLWGGRLGSWGSLECQSRQRAHGSGCGP